ncbi:MAG TPA: RNA methyltransferase [Lachnospiraceae bacterium]|nr:RNA methyltransferase [Lachnospiraceae bacterium]
MVLPEMFTERMEKLLGSEYNAFISSLNEEKTSGLRINTLKLDMAYASQLPFKLDKILWADEGFYYSEDSRPGQHPLHDAGAYYIQEPSAMAVASLLEPGEGELVCDLCAAPGGKSTHIAAKLKGTGLLVSNEISAQRARILSQNIERLGICNAIVCNETPERLAASFPQYFDKILVDAPCSGEGMFRKDMAAIKEWSPENVKMCAMRQKLILGCADAMLKPGGIIVYSTCTFAPAEDEEMLIWFLRQYEGYRAEAWQHSRVEGFGTGQESFVPESLGKLSEREKEALACAIRLWPHKIQGEGHFAVRLRKPGTYGINVKSVSVSNKVKHYYASKKELKELEVFLGAIFIKTDISDYAERLIFFGDNLFLVPQFFKPELNINIIRAGLHIAVRKKGRFEPAHALCRAARPEDVKQYQDCDYDTILKFLHGEVINCNSGFKGWVLIGYNGLGLGWGKAQDGTVKNHYPKGLRRLKI